MNGKKLAKQPFSELSYLADSSALFGAKGKAYRVPSGYVYVLGDNSYNSLDSRYYGAIEETRIGGVIYKTIFPFARMRLFRLDQGEETKLILRPNLF